MFVDKYSTHNSCLSLTEYFQRLPDFTFHKTSLFRHACNSRLNSSIFILASSNISVYEKLSYGENNRLYFNDFHVDIFCLSLFKLFQLKVVNLLYSTSN